MAHRFARPIHRVRLVLSVNRIDNRLLGVLAKEVHEDAGRRLWLPQTGTPCLPHILPHPYGREDDATGEDLPALGAEKTAYATCDGMQTDLGGEGICSARLRCAGLGTTTSMRGNSQLLAPCSLPPCVRIAAEFAREVDV